MSIVVNGKEKIIIDRTLINITQKSFDEDGLLKFTMNLKRIGVDFFEIDERTFNSVRPLISSEAFIFRIDKMYQLEICRENDIEYIIIREEDLDLIKICGVEKDYNFKVILEIDVNTNKNDFMQKISEDIDLNRLFSIRFSGVSNCFFNNYIFLSDYINGKYNVKTNIYASDEFYMATAVGFQAAIQGIDYITTAFCGRDGVFGTTALEELLVSLKVIMGEKNISKEEVIYKEKVISGEKVGGGISLLSEMRKQYEKITYTKVAINKPIIGKDIFKYESGVHVAGIEKNPITYEPFMPEIVGMKRKLALGKHSGKNSITSKLKELSIDNKFSAFEILNILGRVKNKSITNKAEVTDKDFIDICRGIKE